MSEEKVWKSWKERWKSTEKSAIEIVEEVFRVGGTRPIHKVLHPGKPTILIWQVRKDGLDFAIEMGWLKDCLNESYKVTCSGLLMLAHQVKT